MLTRPKAVSFVSWFLILASLVGFAALYAAARGGGGRHSLVRELAPLLVTYAVASAIQILMALGMLRGKNWARLVFLWLTPISIALGGFLGASSEPVLFKACWYLVCAYLLCRPHVVRYFDGTAEIIERAKDREAGFDSRPEAFRGGPLS